MGKDNLDEKRKRMAKRPLPPRARRAVKRRVRPARRVAARKARATKRPMPPPPARRPLRPAAKAPPKTTANPELVARVTSLQNQFADLESKAQLGDVYNAIGEFDARLVELPLALEALRTRGYVHSEQLDDRLEALEEQWDETRPRVEATLQSQVERLDRQLDEVERHVHRLRPVEFALRPAESVMNALTKRIEAAETAVSNLYAGMETERLAIEAELNVITAMMNALAESSAIQLRETEGPLLAVKSEWRRDGDEGPEGMLFLTDQRILFEQRQEIVTKKRLGIFKAESEKIQELLLDIEVTDIESLEHREEGGFLGMGKDDILDLVLSANAPVSRARFHLKGQDSSAWAAMIKRVQSGEIDDDRAGDYVEELEEAAETVLAFPTECPNCFAAVPTPPRGVVSVTCEYCNAVITPTRPGDSHVAGHWDLSRG